MENLILDKFFKPFQFIGLQCFSVKNIKKESNKKYPLIYYNIYLVVLVIWTTSFGALNYNRYTNLNSSNYLHVVIKFINFVNYALSIYLTLLVSFFRHSTLVKFFTNSSQIIDLCLLEFNYKIDFRKIVKELGVSMLVLAVILAKLFYDLVVTSKGNFGTLSHLLSTFWWLIAIFIYMIVLRFNFHVCLVNFHLTVLNEIIMEHFSYSRDDVVHDWKSTVKTLKVYPINYIKRMKIIGLKKILMLIKEMSNCVNETMGLIILLRLMMIITNMIRFGYDFLKNISEPMDVSCKILALKIKSISKCEDNFTFSDLLYWVFAYSMTLFMIFSPCQKTQSKVSSCKQTDDIIP